MYKLLTGDSEALSTGVDMLLVGRVCIMHKGTKLGPRDRWQMNMNYSKRQAYKYFKQLQVLKKRFLLRKQLADLESWTEENIKKLNELKRDIDTCESLYKAYLRDFQFYSYRKKYAKINQSFIAPYIEKYGEKAAFIYVFKTIEENPVYKIGMTRNLKSRADSYNTKKTGIKTPYEFIFIFHTEEVELVERLLIELFKDKVAKGKEWFYLSAEDLELIQRIFKKSLDNKK